MNEIRIPQVERQSSGGDSVDAGKLAQALWRGKWYFLILPAIAAGGMHMWLRGQRNLYRTTAQIQVSPKEVNPLKDNSSSSNKARTVLKQQQILVKSPAILKPLAESESIRGLRTFSRQMIKDKPLIAELNDLLGTVVDPNTDRLQIACMSPFPDEAAKIARATTDQYIQYHRDKKRASAQESADILRGELDRYLDKREEIVQKINELRTENKIIQGSETFLESHLTEQKSLWNKAKIDMIKHQATVDTLGQAEQDPELFLELGKNRRSLKQNPNLEADLAGIETELRAKEAELERRQRDEGEKLLSILRREIEVLKERKRDVLLQYARSYKLDTEIALNEARHLAASLEQQVEGLEDEVARTNSALQSIANLEAEYDRLSEFSDDFKSRLGQLDVENQTGALNIDVIDYGRPSSEPASPDRVGMMVYAIMGGFGLAFGFVLLRSFTDRRIRGVEEVPRLLNVNVVGVMPHLKGRARKRAGRITEDQPASSASEAVRNLRTAVNFALPKSGSGIVFVTSAVSGEGKSVTASNLAHALATGGRRTLLIDGDLRHPGLHDVYGVPNAVGLGHVMTRSTTIGKAIVQNVAAGLDLLPAGDSFGKPAELFEGETFPELLSYLRNRYDCLVIDSPPLLESSEARVIASEVDLSVFVTRLGVSMAPSAVRAIATLRAVDSRVVGAFVNDDRDRKSGTYTGGISYGALRTFEPVGAASSSRDAEG